MSPTTSATATTDWPPAGWITKKTAAERAKLSEERIAGLVREVKLHSSKGQDPQSRQTCTLIHEGDLERYLHERAHPPQKSEVVRAVNTPDKPNTPQLALPSPAPAEASVKPVSVSRPWLTLEEAEEYSGLTKRWLLQCATNELGEESVTAQSVAVRDMGKHSPGGRWRFHRESLGDR
jgi:hypothetical protein